MKHILVVEDNPELAKLLELMLRREGYSVTTAGSGDEALQEFQKHAPDLVLLDIMLPEMNGYEVCAYIRRELHSEVPVVMLSALDSPIDMNLSREVGATAHIAKPFDKDQLLSVLAGYVGSPRTDS